MFSYGFALKIKSLYGSSRKRADLNVIKGPGVPVKKDSGGKIVFEVKCHIFLLNNDLTIQIVTPFRQVNTCGFLISADLISNLTISWQLKNDKTFHIIARPDNGNLVMIVHSVIMLLNSISGI